MERQLSNTAIQEMRRGKQPAWGHKEKRKTDRRKALFSCVDPAMERRSNIDRRRD